MRDRVSVTVTIISRGSALFRFAVYRKREREVLRIIKRQRIVTYNAEGKHYRGNAAKELFHEYILLTIKYFRRSRNYYASGTAFCLEWIGYYLVTIAIIAALSFVSTVLSPLTSARRSFSMETALKSSYMALYTFQVS